MAAKELSLARHFADLPDPRVDRTKKHSLLDILGVAFCAVLSGADSFEEIEEFGNLREDWLKTFLKLPHGIPSHDTFNRVFAALDPKRFAECVGRWMESVCEAMGLRHVAIDGKAVRSSPRSTFSGCLHVVSAWATEQGAILGQTAVEDGSNEITAIPELLKVLHLKGALVSIDAAGCQREIAREIREKGGHYLLAVKGNQSSLHAAVEAAFARATDADFVAVDTDTQDEKGHGRIEQRCVSVIHDPTGLPDGWTDVAAVVMVGREREVNGGASKATVHYYITSLRGTAKELAKLVRRHWAVENELHWSLDVTFREDHHRTLEKHAGENVALVRRACVSLLKQDPRKGALKGKRKQAGWNTDYLLMALRGFPTN